MDKWTLILLEAEEMWASSAAASSLRIKGVPCGTYAQERDLFKASRIYDLYGYEYFRRFIDRCPHIIDMFDDIVPCSKKDTQCSMFCHKYDFERGCTKYANE